MKTPAGLERSKSHFRIKSTYHLPTQRNTQSRIQLAATQLQKISKSLFEDSPKKKQINLNLSNIDSPQSLENLQTKRISNILLAAKKRLQTLNHKGHQQNPYKRKKSPEEQSLLQQWKSKLCKRKWGANLGLALYQKQKLNKMKVEARRRRLPQLSFERTPENPTQQNT